MTDDEVITILDLAAQRDRDDAEAAVAYLALKKARKLSSHRLLTYRCPRGQLLLDVVQLPKGLVFHVPSYILPPAVNEVASTGSGRQANTLDGDNHWKWQTFFARGNVELNCRHDAVVRLPSQGKR